MSKSKKKLSKTQQEKLFEILENRFEENFEAFRKANSNLKGLSWKKVKDRIEEQDDALDSLFLMEESGGEPCLVDFEKTSDTFIFFDCSVESPKERMSLCYDKAALDSRKENKPKNSATQLAESMGLELLTEEQYFFLQRLGNFDTKTSSWLKTPAELRKLGGAIFGDRRFGRVFVYHNGAQSYYAGRGFRGCLKV